MTEAASRAPAFAGWRRVALVLAVIAATLGVDRITKVLALRTLVEPPPIVLLGGAIRLQTVENPGSMLSLGAGWSPAVRSWVLIGAVGVFLVGALVLALVGRRLCRIEVLGLALIVGGGAGNLLDRVTRDGLVVDFVNLGVGPVRTGVFNAADVFVMAGLALAVIGIWATGRSGDG